MKFFKKVATTALAVVALGGTVAPVSAQSVNYKELVVNTTQALQTIESVNGKLTFHLSVEQNGQKIDVADVNATAVWDFLKMSGDLKADVKQLVTGQSFKGQLTAKDGKVVTGYSEVEGEEPVYNEVENGGNVLDLVRSYLAIGAVAVAEPTEVSDEAEANTLKYFDLKQENGQNVFALKQGIDGKAFFKDNQAEIEAWKQRTLEQAAKQGQTVTDEQRKAIDLVFSEAAFEKFFASNPKFEVHYDVQTNYFKGLVVEVNLDLKDFGAAEESVKLQANVNLEMLDYNQPVDVTLPSN